jgi:hypothetical protein
VFVDLPEAQVPADKIEAQHFNLKGLPVRIGAGPSSDIGLQAGRSLALGHGLSLEGATSLSRTFVPSAMFSPMLGTTALTASPTARYQQGGWDIAVFPSLSAGSLSSYVLGSSVAHQSGGGWTVEASSRYERRQADALAGDIGANSQGRLGITHLPLLGAEFNLDYGYDSAQPSGGTATLSQGPSIELDLALLDALNCRVGYRYAFSGAADASFASLADGGQDFTVGWDWDLAEQGIRGTTFSAGFVHHRDFFAAAGPAANSGEVTFATSF